MLTNKITGFSADLLNTVRGILGEAKKCPADCECEKCEAEDEDEKEEAKEGYVPTSDEPTDANKKTAQKIRDMMAKEKKPVKEESEELDELSKPTMGRYINKAKDHIDSASYRQGHKEAHGSTSRPLERKLSKRHKGIETAVKKLTKEDAEQIDEISKATLGSYIKKASGAEQPKNVMSPKNVPLTKIAAYQGDSETGHFGKRFNQATYDKAERLRKNRETGIKTAVNKLTKEDAEQIEEAGKQHIEVTHVTGQKSKKPVSADNAFKALNHYKSLSSTKSARIVSEDAEQIDELSKDTMGRYINKAATKMGSQGVTAGLKIAADEKSSKNFKDMGKREKGIKLAVSKLTKEEQDFIDALNADTLDEARGRPRKAGAKDFTIHPKTKEKLMHNNPEHMKKIEALQKNKVLDKPKVEAGQHIMNQLSKAKTSMQGGSTIHFTHGDSKHVSGTHAAKLISKYQAMKPSEKEDFQKKIGHSHEQLMKHV